MEEREYCRHGLDTSYYCFSCAAENNKTYRLPCQTCIELGRRCECETPDLDRPEQLTLPIVTGGLRCGSWGDTYSDDKVAAAYKRIILKKAEGAPEWKRKVIEAALTEMETFRTLDLRRE